MASAVVSVLFQGIGHWDPTWKFQRRGTYLHPLAALQPLHALVGEGMAVNGGPTSNNVSREGWKGTYV